jgi:hypothetical protein
VAHLSEHNQLDLRVLHGNGTNTVAKKGGDGIGYSGHTPQKGEKVIAIIDNNGYVLASLPVAPVNVEVCCVGMVCLLIRLCGCTPHLSKQEETLPY